MNRSAAVYYMVFGLMKKKQIKCNKCYIDAYFHGIYAVNDITRRYAMLNSIN